MTVKRVMTRCSGALILGLSQLVIGLGVRKPGTSGEGAIQNIRLPTAWNHLEAGMAFALGLPLLIVRESNVSPEGIFDPSVADYFVHHGDMTPNWLDSEAFRQPFDEWIADVVKYAGN